MLAINQSESVIMSLPSDDTMYKALLDRDAHYEGVFIVGVTTTGIYCRPVCSARKPLRKNVQFFSNREQARSAGFRACKVCKPDTLAGSEPEWLLKLKDQLDNNERISDADLSNMGIDPARVRRWFNKHYGTTFQAWQRARRLSAAHDALQADNSVTETAFASGFESLSGFGEAFQRVAGCSPKAGKNARLLKVKRLLSPLGPMFAAASDEGLCLLEFDDRKAMAQQLSRLQRVLDAQFVAGEHPIFDLLERQLIGYFKGELTQFSVPLQFAGTEFQKNAWQALVDIPYGQTRSYADQAIAIGKPAAVRAVARANGQNALAIIVPCHRVVGKDGKLTGYAGGLWRKQKLLALEQSDKQVDLFSH
ncbi:MAG: bifunctional transcriptional activator/DNA repair enzyme AdaA [Pseudomonadales bacterium]